MNKAQQLDHELGRWREAPALATEREASGVAAAERVVAVCGHDPF